MAAILAAVVYGAYMLINRNPGANTLSDIAQDWNNMLKIEPGSGASPGSGPASNAGMAPPFVSPAPHGERRAAVWQPGSDGQCRSAVLAA